LTEDAAPRALAPSYSAHVFSAADLEVVAGANIGDPLMPFDELCLGDLYQLLPDAEALSLAIRDAEAAASGSGRFLAAGRRGQSVAQGSEIGRPGDTLTLEGRLTFMAPDGDRVELLLVGHQEAGAAGRMLYFLPLTPVEPKVGYTLLDLSEDPGEVRLSDIAPVAFTRGTMITLADGSQRAIEDLAPGDRALTRDHGSQPVRWVGRRTVRAIGPYAPVVIARGVLSNESDMVLSQYQRLFIYQRGGGRLAGTSEVLIRARDLVDGERVFLRPGGFIDYFHLVFDQHEIIYAECVPTESLLIDDRTLGRLPEDLALEVAARLPELRHRPHFGTEADKAVLARFGPDVLLRAPRRG